MQDSESFLVGKDPTDIELLWQGIWNYVRIYDLDVMLGCASFEGTDPETLHAFVRNFCRPTPSVPAVAGTVFRQMVAQPGVYSIEQIMAMPRW